MSAIPQLRQAIMTAIVTALYRDVVLLRPPYWGTAAGLLPAAVRLNHVLVRGTAVGMVEQSEMKTCTGMLSNTNKFRGPRESLLFRGRVTCRDDTCADWQANS